MGLLPAEAQVAAGRILFQGRDVLTLDRESRRKLRGAGMALVFQDPFSVLNPSMRIGAQIGEGLVYHRGLTREAALARAVDLLREVGIAEAARRGRRLSARAVGRHAPARADRRRAGGRARPAGARRADHRARRHHRGADPRSAGAAAGPARARHAVHQPQPGRGAPHRRRGRRALRRPGRGAGADRRRAGAAAASLHQGPAGRRSAPGHEPRPAGLHSRAAARPAGSRRRLPVPAALSLRCRCVRLAAGASARGGPLRAMPSRGRSRRRDVARCCRGTHRVAEPCSAAFRHSGGCGQRPRQDLHAVARPLGSRLRGLAAALPADAHPRRRRRGADGRRRRGGRAGRRVRDRASRRSAA